MSPEQTMSTEFPSTEILLATGNAGKLADLRRIFADVSAVRLISLADVGPVDEVVEDRDTFVGNAEKKAQEIAAATQRLTLADDSGLEVDALDGAPGVYSARYSGPEATPATNNDKLLAALADVPDAERTARFRCVLVLCSAEGRVLHVADGSCEGHIGRELRGTNGFGYDPLFTLTGETRTMAELSADEKNRRSHRAAAAAKMLSYLSQRYG